MTVAYEVRWLGQGEPGVVDCTYSFFDSTGMLVHKHQGTFYSAQRHLRARRDFWVAAFAQVTPARVEVACSPFEM